MAKTVVTLPFKRETKNMLMYEVPPEEKKGKTAAVPTLYINQNLFKQGEWPDSIKVTIEPQ